MNRIIVTFSLLACFSFLAEVGAVPITGQGTWESTLHGRDLDGDPSDFEAYYDSVLNITWLAETSIAGALPWASANDWASSLSIFGVSGWRLPRVIPINGVSFDAGLNNNASTDRGYADGDGWTDGAGNPTSEMGNMYYVTLGNLGFCTPDNSNPGSCSEQVGWGLANTGPFNDLQSMIYWSGSEVGGISFGHAAWDLNFSDGDQHPNGKDGRHLAWAVRDGDVLTIPEPATVALAIFGLTLLGRRMCGKSGQALQDRAIL